MVNIDLAESGEQDGEAGRLGWGLPITGSSSCQCDCGNQGTGCSTQNSQTGSLLRLQPPGALPSPAFPNPCGWSLKYLYF